MRFNQNRPLGLPLVQISLAHIPGGCALPVSATSIGATLHWRDCAFSVDLSSDDISATSGRQSFVLPVASW